MKIDRALQTDDSAQDDLKRHARTWPGDNRSHGGGLRQWQRMVGGAGFACSVPPQVRWCHGNPRVTAARYSSEHPHAAVQQAAVSVHALLLMCRALSLRPSESSTCRGNRGPCRKWHVLYQVCWLHGLVQQCPFCSLA